MKLPRLFCGSGDPQLFLLTGFPGWEREGKGASKASPAFHPCLSTVDQHDVLDYCQAQARAPHLPTPGLVHTIKPLKDAREVLLGDTYARIRYGQFYSVIAFSCGDG